MKRLSFFFTLTVLVAGDPMAAQDAGAPARPKPTTLHRDAEEVDPSLGQTLDVAPYDAVLAAHVHDGRVDFAALKEDESARTQLAAFIEGIAEMPATEPLASWINVYNAMVIDFVVERYPLESVTDVPGFWDGLKRIVAGQERSLDDVENRVIRPRFKDARVHFALNCGAVSCPPLPAEAFVQSRLDAQLDTVATAGVNDAAHVKMIKGELHLSELFFWFTEDFEREAGSVQAWIRQFAEPGPLDELNDATPLIQEPYDWRLGSSQTVSGH